MQFLHEERFRNGSEVVMDKKIVFVVTAREPKSKRVVSVGTIEATNRHLALKSYQNDYPEVRGQELSAKEQPKGFQYRV